VRLAEVAPCENHRHPLTLQTSRRAKKAPQADGACGLQNYTQMSVGELDTLDSVEIVNPDDVVNDAVEVIDRLMDGFTHAHAVGNGIGGRRGDDG